MINREEIQYDICEIMINDGPDGHTDGADVITDYIVNLINKCQTDAYQDLMVKADKLAEALKISNTLADPAEYGEGEEHRLVESVLKDWQRFKEQK